MSIDPTLLEGDLVASAIAKMRAALGPLGANVIGPLIGADADPLAAYTVEKGGWIFSGVGNDIRPLRDVEGTGKAAIVASSRDPWAAANQHNTSTFPNLQILIYADVSRDENGNPLGRDAELRCKRIAGLIFPLFHDAANVDHLWPNGLYVVSCVHAGGPAIMDVPEGDGSVRGELRFAVTLP